MLTKAQIEEYNEIGAIVVPDVLTADEVRTLSDVTDGFVDRARGLTEHDAVYDLEDSHTPERPRVRRIKQAHLHDPAYAALSRHPKIIAVLQALWGPDIRFDTAKLNMKCAGFVAPVEWHQDWAFYPHTNDDILAIGVMLDDMDLENGPLMVVPGSHRGPVWNHHGDDGRFCGLVDPADITSEIARAAIARPLNVPMRRTTIGVSRVRSRDAATANTHHQVAEPRNTPTTRAAGFPSPPSAPSPRVAASAANEMIVAGLVIVRPSVEA